MESIVDPAGWQKIGSNSKLKTLYYVENNNTRSGSKNAKWVKWVRYGRVTIWLPWQVFSILLYPYFLLIGCLIYDTSETSFSFTFYVYLIWLGCFIYFTDSILFKYHIEFLLLLLFYENLLVILYNLQLTFWINNLLIVIYNNKLLNINNGLILLWKKKKKEQTFLQKKKRDVEEQTYFKLATDINMM